MNSSRRAFERGASAALVADGLSAADRRRRADPRRGYARRARGHRARGAGAAVDRGRRRRGYRQRRQDQHEGDAARVPVAARRDACSGEVVQQSLGRAADAGADAGRDAVRRARDRHEPRGRDRRRWRSSRGPMWRSSRQSSRCTWGISRPSRRSRTRRRRSSPASSPAASRCSIATIRNSSGSLRRRKRGAASMSCRSASTPQAHVRLVRCALGADRTDIEAECGNGRIVYSIGAPGRHMAQNSAGRDRRDRSAGAGFREHDPCDRRACRASVRRRGGARAKHFVWPGGSILLVDESYNANPASMRAALAALALVPRTEYPRRIAVLGDMLELGERSAELHAGLDDEVAAAGIDLVFAAGPDMKALFERIEPARRGHGRKPRPGWPRCSRGPCGPGMR